jgi:adenylyltransferase/sulfurtransferase
MRESSGGAVLATGLRNHKGCASNPSMNREKYSRQILFPPIGAEGQEKLLESRAVILGCGALGTAQANALTRAGVGTLRIVDRDFVEESNLQRQILFDEADARERMPKAIAAARKLSQINSEVKVEGVVEDVDNRNIEKLVGGFQVVLDATDNFEARYLLNEAAVKHGLPWVYGAVVASYGMTMTILPESTACLACLFPTAPAGAHETCDTVGVISPAVSWVAAIQVTEALKILLGWRQELHGAMLAYDIWKNQLQEIRPRKDPQCRVCGAREFAYLNRTGPTHTSLCGRESVQIHAAVPRQLDLADLRARLEPFGRVRANEFLLVFAVDALELTVFSDGRAIVKGTPDPAVARSVYAKYIGA